jgi:hypothetical protein
MSSPQTSHFTLRASGGAPAAHGESCKTKPISGSPTGTGGKNVRNKAKLGRIGVSGKWTVMVCGATPPESGMCKTNPIPGQPGGWEHRIVQNKPNFPRGRVGRDLGDEGRTCKTNPISPVGRGPGGQNAQNEPNFGERTGRSRGAGCANKPNCRRCADREICVPGSQACQTKPISQLRIADFGSRIGGILPAGRPIVQNEPNLGQLGQRAGGEVYKRSQFGGPIVQDEANPEGEMCKTNPICPRTGRRGCGWSQSCKTNPIPRRLAAGGNTQQSTIPSFHHSSPTRPSASSEDCACRCHPALPPMVGAFVEGLEGILAGCGPGGR